MPSRSRHSLGLEHARVGAGLCVGFESEFKDAVLIAELNVTISNPARERQISAKTTVHDLAAEEILTRAVIVMTPSALDDQLSKPDFRFDILWIHSGHVHAHDQMIFAVDEFFDWRAEAHHSDGVMEIRRHAVQSGSIPALAGLHVRHIVHICSFTHTVLSFRTGPRFINAYEGCNLQGLVDSSHVWWGSLQMLRAWWLWRYRHKYATSAEDVRGPRRFLIRDITPSRAERPDRLAASEIGNWNLVSGGGAHSGKQSGQNQSPEFSCRTGIPPIDRLPAAEHPCELLVPGCREDGARPPPARGQRESHDTGARGRPVAAKLLGPAAIPRLSDPSKQTAVVAFLDTCRRTR